MTDEPGTLTLLAHEVNRLEAALRLVGCEVVDRMDSGLAQETVVSQLESAGLAAPAALHYWFGWRNGLVPGVEPSYGHNTILGWLPLSLQSALALWREQDMGHEPWQWEQPWLPIASGGPTLLVVRCSADETAGLVRTVSPWDGLFSEEQRPAPLSSVLGWWAQALEDGIWSFERGLGAWNRVSHDTRSLEVGIPGLF